MRRHDEGLSTVHRRPAQERTLSRWLVGAASYRSPEPSGEEVLILLRRVGWGLTPTDSLGQLRPGKMTAEHG